jgi:hypothetical protein
VGSHDERVREAVARLSSEQRRLVAACLDAVVRGPYIDDDDEFATVMGVSRREAADVAAAWPQPARTGDSFLAVGNALNNLLGYPHRRWPELSREIGAGEQEVAQALMRWRDQDHRQAGGQGYFDALM